MSWREDLRAIIGHVPQDAVLELVGELARGQSIVTRGDRVSTAPELLELLGRGDVNVDPLARLAEKWREDAERFGDYGDKRGAHTCELHADELDRALRLSRTQAVTLEEAAEIGGYSYSHLQALVAEDKIRNVIGVTCEPP